MIVIGQLSLPVCAVPGCTTIVGEWGLPCDGCVAAFGPMLRQSPGGRRLTEAEITERDEGVRRVYVTARLQGSI